MTHEQNFQRRAATHNLRGKAAAARNRAAVEPVKDPDPKPVKAEPTPTPTKAAATPVKPTVTPDPKTTATNAKTSSSSAAPTSKASTSSLPSTTSSLPSTSASSTSSIPSTTSSLPSTTSQPPTSTPRALPTTTSPPLASPTSAAAANASQTAAPTSTSGLGTMTIVGIIFGSLIGVLIVCVFIAFVIRHMRKKRRGLDGFDSAKFRRSAVMLDEKDQEPEFRPRPPTMIERRQGTPAPASGAANTFPPPPTMAYPYSDHPPMPPAPPAMYGAANPQYGALPPAAPPPSQANAYAAIPGAYGVPAPGAFGAQYDQAGYGAPPIPGTYAPGAYAPYGAAPPDPRYPHHYQQAQVYPQYPNSNSTSYQQQPAVAYGPRMDSLSSSASNAALAERQALRAAEDSSMSSSSSAAQNIGAGMMSASTSSASSSSGGASLKRQPTQVGGAPPAYVDEDGEGARMAAKSDVKVKPIIMSPPGLESSRGAGTSLAPASTAATASEGNKRSNRPVSAYSSYSLYGDDDAYGGI